ncbi:MAG: endonuclease/exonuclease/phosphatase family protein [Pseudomonadota bacterium]
MIERFLKVAAFGTVLLVVLVGCQTVRNGMGPELTPPAGDAIRIATYNVHYIVARDAGGRWSMDGWETRKAPLDTALKSLQSDIIAFQEMETFSGGNDDSRNLAREWLLDRNPEYGAAAIGDWRTFPSTQPIFYHTSRFAVTDQGWFFFSETPDVIYSRTFNGSWSAFASWAQFRTRAGGALFRVVNVHTDYSSLSNRRKSIALVAKRIAPWIDAGETVFVVGDFNALRGSRLHGMLEDEGLTFVPVRGATYHFDRGLNLFGAIDHIGYIGAGTVGDPTVWREKPDGVWPTDHYPVVADFWLPH